MRNNISIIHVAHFETISSVATLECLKTKKSDSKTIDQIIEEDRAIKIVNRPEFEMPDNPDFKDGRQCRRERRKKQNKKKR